MSKATSGFGPSQPIALPHGVGRYRGKADIALVASRRRFMGTRPNLERCVYPAFSRRFQEQKAARLIGIEIRGAPNRGPRAPAPNVPMGAGLFFTDCYRWRATIVPSGRTPLTPHSARTLAAWQAGRGFSCRDVPRTDGKISIAEQFSRTAGAVCSYAQRSSPWAAPLARVDGLEPKIEPAADRQAVFLGATEPRAAGPGKPPLG
jgi:hypothetical protein